MLCLLVIDVISYVTVSVNNAMPKTPGAAPSLLPVTRSDILAGQRLLVQVHVSRVLQTHVTNAAFVSFVMVVFQ